MDHARIIVTVVPAQGVPYHAVLGVGDRVGRDPAVALTLDDDGVSGQHVEIREAAGALAFVDLGSTNGTWLADRAIDTPLTVAVGQSLRVGDTRLRVVALTTADSMVLEVRPIGSGSWHTEVARLPALVVPDADRGVSFGGPQWSADAAVLFEAATGLALVLPVQGARLAPSRVVEADSDGLLEFAGVHFARVLAMEPPLHATDLAFGRAGELLPALQQPSSEEDFPPPEFDRPVVDIDVLRRTGMRVEEREWLALGGGLGSFVWVDALRVHGVALQDIRVIGFEDVPYARYQRLCEHSQIPGHERLRSNSESCPDNLWGFPGYGLRESWRAFTRLRWVQAARTLARLSNEPDRSSTYTPRAADVFSSIDREAERIGWSQMAQTGRIRCLRKTSDGRYVVAVSSRDEPGASRAFFVAPVVHLALGYPGVQFLDDLREYRERTNDFARVVNAYEDHDALYERLRQQGGVVALRGRGIVASRVLQRLYEERQRGAEIRVVHLMRSPREAGSSAGPAQRVTENHWEFQPFNWPEACWGGDLREELAVASPVRRQELLGAWGGTTTADRPDWRQIVREGVKQGWYRIVFGSVRALKGDPGGLNLEVVFEEEEDCVRCDAVIDATGLVSSVRANPVYDDLLDTYHLPRNPQGRLEVDDAFELGAMRNGQGRVFAAGVATLGSGYAPVDSFLGLQYSALASLEALRDRVVPLRPLPSLRAWSRWVSSSAP